MSRKTTQPSTSKGDEPPAKKRKTDPFDNPDDAELWDDDDDFTAAELDDITHQEILASQAITSKPSGSHQAGDATFEERDSSDIFLKPHLSRSSSSIGSHGNNASSRQSRSSSVMSSSSMPRLQNSDSSYPSSLSGYTGNSSSSVRSNGDHSRVYRRPAYLSNGSSSDSDGASAIDEINRIKKECSELKQKINKLNEELCVKDGENRLLRDNLVRKEGELETIKTEKVNIIHQQNKQQSEKEKNLETEVTRLQTQLQFKEKDEQDLSKRVKELETQISSLQTVSSSSQVVSKQSSPKPAKVIVKDISPLKPSREGFPTRKTFMASEGSPRKQLKMSHETPGTSKQSSQETSFIKPENKLRVSAKVCQRSRECHLVAKLLDVSPGVTGQNDMRSIIGLLNTPWISPSIQNIQFDRDKETSLLSPVKSRLSDVNMNLKLSPAGKEGDMVRLVQPDNFNLAMKGLNFLLKEPRTSQPHSETRSHMTQFDLDLSGKSESSSSGSDEGDPLQRISSSLGQSTLDSAILLLPMLNDYLRQYIDMLETSVEIASSSGISNSSSSESFDSWSESPTGSLGILLRSSTTYANNLESLAIASLKTVFTLVNYECVRKVLYFTESEDYSPASDNGSVSYPFSHIPVKVIIKLRLLPKVIRLANPYAKGQLSNRVVVETCLSILEILAKHSQGSDVNSLMPVLTDDVLQHCVENEDEPKFVLHSLLLFKALCKSKKVVSSLCSNATGCVLLSVYSIGIGKKKYLNGDHKTVLPIIKMVCYLCNQYLDQFYLSGVLMGTGNLCLVIESIFYIGSIHKGGVELMMDSDCQCSVEVVKCIVLLLYKVLKIHEQNDRHLQLTGSSASTLQQQHTETIQGTCLTILENGLLLLHLMSQHDHEFMSRHGPVQHFYVMLICGMSQLVKNLTTEKSDAILTAIQELWDFNQDDSELSPDSDIEMMEEGD